MPVQPRILILIEGMTGLEQAKATLLDENTINFYPVPGGYLQNYPGRSDYFDRAKGDPPATSTWGTPPSNAINYTRIFSFVDYLEAEHLVIVGGNVLYEVVGNGAIALYTFKGKNFSGDCFPTMFVHQSKLIILNEGDFPMLWDGVDGVVPLGVQEIPSPPVNIEVSIPWNGIYTAALAGDPYLNGYIYYHWKAGRVLAAGARREDSLGAPIDGIYMTCVQYVDKYGNKGRVSPGSNRHAVPPENPAGVPPAKWNSKSMLTEWEAPRKDEHVHYVIQGRTLTLNRDDSAPLGKPSTFHEEVYSEGTTMTRRWQRLNDSVLASRNLIDTLVQGPQSGGVGTSFGNRIYISDAENNVWYSDISFFGQFRATQQISPYSTLTAIVPAGDRLFIIGDSSTEVWYESSAGPALLEQDIVNGSRYGSTFVAVGDGAIFGLWNEGFGFYDGVKHTYVHAPYYIEKYYLGEVGAGVRSAVKVDDWYYLAIRRDQVSAANNVILMYNFSTSRWFVVNDAVNDIAYWNEEIVGVDDSVYVLYRGGTFAAATIETAGIVSGSLMEQRTISDVRILMEPSSVKTVNLVVSGETRSSEETGDGVAIPLDGINLVDKIFPPYWNKPDALYAGTEWQAPGDVLLQMSHQKPAVGFYHRIRVDFAAGHLVKIKGFEITYSAPFRPEES